MASQQKPLMQFQVVGEDPQTAQAPLFSNFVAVSHAGREVQIEFIFVDINQVAQRMENRMSAPDNPEIPLFHGKTVAKVVVPTWAFLQLKNHLTDVFQKLEVAESAQQEKAGERVYGV
ncbi:MAG: hypothetical protein ABSG08_21815 [Terriglobales bacterium]|jgi:hypothetical protein